MRSDDFRFTFIFQAGEHIASEGRLPAPALELMASEDRLARGRVAYAVALALLDDDSSSASSSSSDDSDAISTDDDDLDVVMESERDLSAEFFLALQDQPGYWWIKPRSDHWVKKLVFSRSRFGDSRFYASFRMRRSSWCALLDRIKEKITMQTTNFRRPIPPEISLLLFLYYCAHGVDFSVLSEKFGVGVSTCSYIIRRVAYAITELGLIKLPLQAEAIKISSMNERHTGVPQCVLSVDGTHIPITQPAHSGKDYYNRKGYYSTVMQAAVDHSLQFRDVVVGWPGSVGDNRVFMNSELGRSHETWLSTFPERVVAVNNTDTQALPMFLLGDSAYANSKYMVTTYELNQITQSQSARRCNKALSGIRYQVEHAFGVLKGRFRLLMKPIASATNNFAFVPVLVVAVCSVHNFLISERDLYTENTDDILREYNSKYPTPEDHNNQSNESTNDDQMSRRVIEKLFMSC